MNELSVISVGFWVNFCTDTDISLYLIWSQSLAHDDTLYPLTVYQVSQKKVVLTTCSSSKCNFFLGHLLQKTSLDQVWVKAI